MLGHLARILGEEEFSALYHQGKSDNIQLSIVGDRTILATIFDSEETTIGMVMFYTKELVEKLNGIFNEIKNRKDAGPKLFNEDFTQMSDVLDDMFGDV